MRTAGLYVRTGPARRLPKGPPWPGHNPDHLLVQGRPRTELHWLTQGPKRTVSCEVCGTLGRLRRRNAGHGPYRHVEAPDWEVRMARRIAVVFALAILTVWVLASVVGT